jgi:uncharacterized protein YndB with AHSA1/START domain
MHTVVDVDLPVPPERVWPHVADLAAYPAWMRLVHRAEAVADIEEHNDPQWDVELRGRVGPFARSKRLRMARTVHEPIRAVRFERAQHDGRDHAQWVLTATLQPADGAGSKLTMDLLYTGGLWTGGVLDRVLENEIRLGQDGLLQVVSKQSIS